MSRNAHADVLLKRDERDWREKRDSMFEVLGSKF